MAVLLSAVSMQRKPRFLLTVAGLLVFVYLLQPGLSPYAALRRAGRGGAALQKTLPPARASTDPIEYVNSSVDWAARPERFPIPAAQRVRLPTGAAAARPMIQYDFQGDPDGRAATDNKLLRDTRRDAVRSVFRRAWESYRQHAWGYDELRPITLRGADGFSGWGATLVDGLDTLWVMGLRDEFDEAVRAVATIDWDAAAAFECSLFETTIRYLGGLLAAYELSGAAPLLAKATELAHMLLAAFDTPNHMPANRLHFERAWQGGLTPGNAEAAAAVGSLALEFTRLAQLTGDARFYDAVARVTHALARVQDASALPGLWPTYLDLQDPVAGIRAPSSSSSSSSSSSFTLGGMADSLYEYLPKMHLLLAGRDGTYAAMYAKAADAARRHLLFRPMVPEPEARGHDVLMSGTATAAKTTAGGAVQLEPEGQHLACFAGGMFALGGRLFDRPDDVAVGRRLTDGCVWAYRAFPTGVMPESFDAVPCPPPETTSGGWLTRGGGGGGSSSSSSRAKTTAPDRLNASCPWDEAAWRAAKTAADARSPPGIARVRDARYLLRPEAVESVFVLYRITGDRALQDAAWDMFLAIERSTTTLHANSAIADVTVTGPPQKLDSMESFWFAETLKYLYLTFSDPDYLSLDDYVFNTEAHPFRLPRAPVKDAAAAAPSAAAPSAAAPSAAASAAAVTGQSPGSAARAATPSGP